MLYRYFQIGEIFHVMDDILINL